MILTTKHKADTRTFISGPAGQLELIISEGTGDVSAPWGIICHPHPWYDGTMNNKVVTTLHKTFQACGANTVRFNFRGVGKSEDVFRHHEPSRSEGTSIHLSNDASVFLTTTGLEDLLAVIHWVSEAHAPKTIWLAGFSFGAYIATLAATQLSIEKLVTVAPPVTRFPMQTLPPILCQWILAQGEKDEIISSDAVFAWALKQDPQPIILRFPSVGHFFHGALQELQARVQAEMGG